MTEYEKEQFWEGLNRLYKETVDLRAVAEAHQRVVERHQFGLESHEKRLDRLDVIVEWLAERERAREQQ